ncbi:YbaN family protein [Seminibacterium arietis]|uniref:Inner membrane protein n=1 Tax=Seminibacterium arietis TaxID=1173502 RepID=A0ABW3I8T5_9PAST
MKPIYISLGCIFLGLGVLGVILPILPTTPFLLLTVFFFAKGSDRLHNWFLQTKLYNLHLKSFKEQRALSRKSKVTILSFATLMLMIGFYFTPSVIGRSIILLVLLVKYWFFFFWIKTIKE